MEQSPSQTRMPILYFLIMVKVLKYHAPTLDTKVNDDC